MTTRDRAIYEPMRLSAAEAEFSRRYPEFDPDGALAELRRLEYGRLDDGGQISPGDPGWDGARRAWNLAVDQRPAAVAVPETTQHVVAAVNFAREHGLRVAVQGAGHNAVPLGPLADTLLIKTHAMRRISIDPIIRSAWAEAGVLWQEVADAAGGHGLAGLAGSSPDVGVVGYTLGGGLSWLSRCYGLSANNVEAFELVTADGAVVRADAASEPDLFWALRGGGGSFGVVTGIELRLFAIPEVYAGRLWWPAEAGHQVLHAWRELTERELPDEFTTTVHYRNFPPVPGQSFAVVDVIHLGPPAEANELLAPLRRLRPLMDTVQMIPTPELGHLHGDPEHPVPGVADGALLAALPAEAVDEIVWLCGDEACSPPLGVELRHLGGEMGRTHPHNGALDAVPADYLLVANGMAPTAQAAEAIRVYIEAMKSAVSPWTARQMYLNLAQTAQDPASFWSPEVYDRLRRIKAAVDPRNMIRANHPIPPAGQFPVPPPRQPDRRLHRIAVKR